MFSYLTRNLIKEMNIQWEHKGLTSKDNCQRQEEVKVETAIPQSATDGAHVLG